MLHDDPTRAELLRRCLAIRQARREDGPVAFQSWSWPLRETQRKLLALRRGRLKMPSKSTA